MTNLLLAGSACAYTVDRRTVFQSLGAAAGVSALGPRPADAVISSKYCASGVGEGCTDLSEGNDLIRSLQEKSATNRERNEKAGSVQRTLFDQLLAEHRNLEASNLTIKHYTFFFITGSPRCVLYEELSRLVRFGWQNAYQKGGWNVCGFGRRRSGTAEKR